MCENECVYMNTYSYTILCLLNCVPVARFPHSRIHKNLFHDHLGYQNQVQLMNSIEINTVLTIYMHDHFSVGERKSHPLLGSKNQQELGQTSGSG